MVGTYRTYKFCRPIPESAPKSHAQEPVKENLWYIFYRSFYAIFDLHLEIGFFWQTNTHDNDHQSSFYVAADPSLQPVATLKSDWLASRAKIDRSSLFRAHFRLLTIVASNPSRDICSGLCRPCPSSCSAPVYWWVYQRATMLDVSLVVHPVVHAVFLG